MLRERVQSGPLGRWGSSMFIFLDFPDSPPVAATGLVFSGHSLCPAAPCCSILPSEDGGPGSSLLEKRGNHWALEPQRPPEITLAIILQTPIAQQALPLALYF